MKNKLSNMMCLDLFLFSKEEEEYNSLKPHLTPSESIQAPLKSFDIYLDYFSSEMNKLERENDINVVKELATKFQWNNNLNDLFKDETFEALVVTNKNQEIIWVNDGFKKMTGYPKSYALKKTPSFLQGAQTCEKTKKRIREKLQIDKPFSDVVINYKKDNTVFKCEIKVFPLLHNGTTHYIALEKAV